MKSVEAIFLVVGCILFVVFALVFKALTKPVGGRDTADLLQGQSDEIRRPDLENFYRWLVAEAEKQATVDSIADPLALGRIVNAANKIADEARREKSKSYPLHLPFLLATAQGPQHFSTEVTWNQLMELGVVRR